MERRTNCEWEIQRLYATVWTTMKIMIDGRSILLEKMSGLFIGRGTVANMRKDIVVGKTVE